MERVRYNTELFLKKDALQEDVPFIKLYQESLLNYLALGVPAAFLTMTFRLSLLNTPHL